MPLEISHEGRNPGSAGNCGIRIAAYGLAVILAGLIAFAGFEVYARYQFVQRYNDSERGLPLIIQNQPLHIAETDRLFGRNPKMDPEGFYFKVNEAFVTGLVLPNGQIQEFVARTNHLGYLSDKQYRMERDPKTPEYRIAVLGDSMTGTTTSTRQWVDTLEDLLNGSGALRKAVGGKVFKTINLGWPGAGFEAFEKAYFEKAKKFTPDLVVVNFIELDFPRTVAGPHLVDMDEAVTKAEQCLRRIATDHANLLITFMPVHEDLFPEPRAALPPLTRKLRELVKPIEVVDMKSLMPAGVGAEKGARWFNLPHDTHYSALGGEIYARAMASKIGERLTGRRMDFSLTPSRFFDPDRGGSPGESSQPSYALKILHHPEKLQALRRAISERYLKTKTQRTGHLYSMDKLKGMKGNFFMVPPGIPVTGGFEKISFGTGSDDYGYLNVICKTPPITIDNPDCYQFYYVMVKE